MADKISLFRIPRDFPSAIWDDIQDRLNPTPLEFFLETMDIIAACICKGKELFKPTYLGTVNEPRPTVYLLSRNWIAPPYLTAEYMAPFDTVRGRSTIIIHPDEGQTIDVYVNSIEAELKSETKYEIKHRIRGGKKQILITGPPGHNWLDESSSEIKIDVKPYDVSKDDRIGKTDFDITPYDPNEGKNDDDPFLI